MYAMFHINDQQLIKASMVAVIVHIRLTTA